MSQISITLNGEEKQIASSLNLAEFLDSLNLEQGRKGLAVCRNLEIIPADSWAEEIVKEGDRLEILIAAPGG